MFENLPIRTKIAGVVALLLVALAGVGLIAILKMRAINENTVQIATNWLPSVRVLGELRTGLVRYRSVLREHMLSETIEEKLATERTLESVLEATNKLRQVYEPMIASPGERALYDEWVRTWTAYNDGAAKVMALSRKEVGGVPYEAHTLNRTVVNKLSTAAEEFLRKDIDLNDKGAADETLVAAHTYRAALWLVSMTLCAAVFIGTAASYLLVRDVSRGIASIVKPMQSLGNGDLTADVPARGQRTEIGVMSDALQIFKEALIAKRASDEAASSHAEARIERGRRVDQLTRDFEGVIGEIVGNVSSASIQLESSAGTLTAAAVRSQQLSTAVAAASEEASANVQSVASATEELSSSVSEISRQVQESARMAADAVGQARGTTERVSELSKAATRIGDVIELINTIAGQTNLLALNATIEAARAGDAGRGFAVVASEVKALAEQTAKATGEIGLQINGIQTATQESVNAIKEISGAIEKLSEISSAIAAAVEEQGAATREISRNVQQAAQGTQQVSANIADVQCGATETGAASSQVLSAAQTLSVDSGHLKAEVSKFLANVRVA